MLTDLTESRPLIRAGLNVKLVMVDSYFLD
jgi:hypothetical protein